MRMYMGGLILFVLLIYSWMYVFYIELFFVVKIILIRNITYDFFWYSIFKFRIVY